MKKTYFFFLIIIGIYTNADAQWETVHWYNTTQNLDVSLFDLEFTDSQNGFILGQFDWPYDATIFRTENAGDDFDTLFIDSTTRLNELEIVNGNMIYAVGVTINNGFILKGVIMKSIDNGVSWSKDTCDYELYTINFPSDSIGYSAGYNGLILKTIDSGNNWDTIQQFSNKSISDLFFINNDIGIAICDSAIYRTTDGGLSWSKTNVGGRPYGMSFPSDSIGYLLLSDINLFNDSVEVYKTNNGGISWFLVSTISATNGRIINCAFGSDNVGYVIGQYVVLKTIDGGINWVSQSSSLPTFGDFGDDLYDIQILNGDTAFISGRSQFYRTTTGGNYFSSINEKLDLYDFELYPNPASSLLNISSNDIINDVYIYNSVGSLILYKSLENENSSIITSDFVDGIYYVKMGEKTKKLIISH